MASDEQLPSLGRFLFFDGFRTTSAMARLWLDDFRAACPMDFQPDLVFDYFSYDPTSSQYELHDTHVSIPRAANDVPSCLEQTTGSLSVVAYSLGGPLALRGLRRTLDDLQPITLDRLILVAPAIWPHRSLGRLYRANEITAQALVELLDPSQRLLRVLVRDILGTLEEGTHVTVLHSTQDDWCPWKPELLPLAVTESPRLTTLDLSQFIPKASMNSVNYHLRLRDDPQVLRIICERMRARQAE